MLHLEILENTAYNPMIYIPFFIVILIDKRGVREAKERRKERENGTKRLEHITIYITIYKERYKERYPAAQHRCTTAGKRGMRRRHTTAAQHSSTAHHRAKKR